MYSSETTAVPEVYTLILFRFTFLHTSVHGKLYLGMSSCTAVWPFSVK